MPGTVPLFDLQTASVHAHLDRHIKWRVQYSGMRESLVWRARQDPGSAGSERPREHGLANINNLGTTTRVAIRLLFFCSTAYCLQILNDISYKTVQDDGGTGLAEGRGWSEVMGRRKINLRLATVFASPFPIIAR